MQDDNKSKWDFDAPKFWDFTGILDQKKPADSWFSESTISGPSFPSCFSSSSPLKKKRPAHLESSENPALKRKKISSDVFSRLTNTKTVSSAIKSSTYKTAVDYQSKKLPSIQGNKQLSYTKSSHKPQAILANTKPSKFHEDSSSKTNTRSLQDSVHVKQAYELSSSYTSRTPPEQIRTIRYEPDTPLPPHEKKDNEYYRNLHKEHRRKVEYLRERIKRFTQNIFE